MIIGITGSIATGKSTVIKYLISKDYIVIDSDEIVHYLLTLDEVLQEISTAFKENLVHNEVLDRKKLGEIIFNNKEKRIKLNKIMHPRVISIIQALTASYKGKGDNLIFVDIPLLYEEKLEYLVDKIIVVYISLGLQIKRLMERDKIDKVYARKKISAGMNIEEKKQKADYLINNSFSYTNTYKEIEEILRRIKNEN